MHRMRTRRRLVLFSIGVVVFAAFLPLVGVTYTAVLVPLWIVAPLVVIGAVLRRSARCDEQPVSLLSVLLSRAPPRSLLTF
jgi:hypothetical protein